MLIHRSCNNWLGMSFHPNLDEHLFYTSILCARSAIWNNRISVHDNGNSSRYVCSNQQLDHSLGHSWEMLVYNNAIKGMLNYNFWFTYKIPCHYSYFVYINTITNRGICSMAERKCDLVFTIISCQCARFNLRARSFVQQIMLCGVL